MMATIGFLAGGQRKPQAPREQTDFSAEADGVDRPIPIPDDVLKKLEEDDFVVPAVKNSDPPVQRPPASWFSSSRVHLATPEQQDLVVLGEGPLAGANLIMFWVFRDSGHGYELVLRAGAHDLHIKRRRFKGYRYIETDSVASMQSNSVLYRFTGTRYAVQRHQTQPIK